MKQTRFRRILSHIYDIPIESLGSEYNESLELVLSMGRYQLLTQGAIYSYEDKYDNYKYSFEQYNLSHFIIHDVLLLGMGMLSIPIILERIFQKKYSYTGVEIDDAVIYLASKYIIDELLSPIEIINTDANIFMQVNSQKFDMICMDVFIDDKIPETFQTLDFLLKIKESLSPNGLLFFNWLAVSSSDIESAENYYKNIFKKVFPNGTILVLASNRMLVNVKPN